MVRQKPAGHWQFVFELQQDWARTATYEGVMNILRSHSPYGIQVRFSKWALGRSGDVQRMSAGSGITHSEYNSSTKEPLHFLQIWIKPDVLNIKPSYEERRFAQSDKRGTLRLIVSPNGADDSISVHQDASLYSGLFDTDEVVLLPGTDGRAIYVHVARGEISANGIALSGGDALRIVDGSSLRLERGHGAEVLVFDLPPIISSAG